MATLLHSTILSLDGCVADTRGDFDWAGPDEDVRTVVDELCRPIGTSLLGRGMTEVMAAWETLQTDGQPPLLADFADIWRSADTLVDCSMLVAPRPLRSGWDAHSNRRPFAN
jgi:hypothetical protein